MADAESIRQVAQSRAPFSTWLGVVLLFALFGVIVLAVIGPAPRGDDYEQKRAKPREEKLKTAREEDAKALTSYGWIDKNKGVARIPVARMGGVKERAYEPDPQSHERYTQLYAEWVRLHDYFGRGGNAVMKRLRALRTGD